MTTLTQARADLSTALADAGLPAIDHEPDRPAPPQVVVSPGSPWMEPAGTFSGMVILAAVLRIVVPPGSRTYVLNQLEDLTTRVLTVIDDSEWSLDHIERPVTLIVDSSRAFPCVDVVITRTITL